jgi:biofilm protein TabA
MKIKLSIVSLVLFATFNFACTVLNSPQRWFKQQEISKGLSPKVYSDVNAEEFKKQYAANKPAWDKAFEFMKTQDLKNLAPGKYPIDGEEVFASVTEIIDKPFEDTKWESHQKYIDLQYIIRGAEKMGKAPSEGAKVINPYSPAKDVANYEIRNAKLHLATPKEFFLFFPSDAHRPNIKVNEELVKKLVIKIRVK